MLCKLLFVALVGCFGTSKTVFGQAANGTVRLVGGNDASDGRVEIFHQGIWGTVCDDDWDDNDAIVICRMLRFSDGIAAFYGKYGPGSEQIWLDNVRCLGNESAIDQCEKREWGENNCNHGEDAGVLCRPKTDISIRLVGGNDTSEGRVEILKQCIWGTVCTDDWDDNDAIVVCRMLGYTDGIAVVSGKYGPGTGKILLDDTRCTGNEDSLDECDKQIWGLHDCQHHQDAGVICTNRTVRLVGGNDASDGRVEIFHQGIWGTVCDDGWDDNDAIVICRMLGYSGGVASGLGTYVPGTGQIWLDDVGCLGNESAIDQCEKKEWGDTDCSHEVDAGVLCNNS